MSDDELRTKKDSLLKELRRRIWHEEFWGDQNYRATLGLIGIAIAASIAAGILGLLEFPPKAVGLTSFLPGALTLIATTFNFQRRATVHRRKARLLNQLEGRFIYQMPTLPSADQIALIHREMTEIESEIAKEEDAITVDFGRVENEKR
jgi:hypothetical protein